MTVQTDRSTWVQSVPVRMESPPTTKRCPIQKSQIQGIRGDRLSAGFASCAQRFHSKGMPWWGWSSRSGMHARSHAGPILLAPHGCPGKGTYWQVSPMPHFQSQAAQGPSGKHHGHTSLRACPPWLPVSGTQERSGGKCFSGNRSFHLINPSVCYPNPNHPDHFQNPMGQVHCSLWVTQKDPVGSRWEFWKSAGGWSLYSDRDPKAMK